MKDFLQELSIFITLLFKRELTEGQASWIFRKAIRHIPEEKYMCIVLRYHTCRACKIPIEKLERFGFTRENYHKFINEHYPELVSKLRTKTSVWIYLDDEPDKALKSKQEFLMLLSLLNVNL